jgi:lipoprotein-anchoring transpeptidase ErfK/SrfK
MLNRLISLTGLALVVTLVVPSAQQARSGHLPPQRINPLLSSAPQLEPVVAAVSPAAAVPLAEIPAAIPSGLPIGTALDPSQVALAPPAQEVRVEIHLRRREALVYQGSSVVKRYPIGVGRPGWETPTGTFQVSQMRENPTWISPFNGQRIPGGHARNPLGTRWIGFWTDGHNWIGFHGTLNSSTVGRNVSHGCLHMHKADLEDLYRRVTLGTLVTVL